MSVFTHLIARSAMTGVITMASVALGQAQDRDLGVPINLLELSKTLACKDVAKALDGQSSGAQWLIGGGIKIYPLAGSRKAVAKTGNEEFLQVNCYSESGRDDKRRVFVATENLTRCGWVPRSALLKEYRRKKLDKFKRQSRPICEAARAMPLGEFCKELKKLVPEWKDSACDGFPLGLRAKGVLLGSETHDAVFRSAPGGEQTLANRTFFSILEIHDVALNETREPVVLVGDGDGDIFGWVEFRHLEIWPTRLGLFYDAAGEGRLFSNLGDLITNWRQGAPPPNIEPGLSNKELEDYIHGERQLLSYPIMRTVDPKNEISANPEDSAYHEVILLGRSESNTAEDLVSQVDLAEKVGNIRRLNVMLVMDTTESMRRYLPLVREGISNFIKEYRENRLNPALQLPDMRMAVYAYSDFQSASATGLNDPIDVETLMPPRAINEGVDLSVPLQAISSHAGLNDRLGLREEAAFEAVVQRARLFGTDQRWFKEGPRFVVHLADHGSRSSLDLDMVLQELDKVRTDYIPLAIITHDEDDEARDARLAFAKQARETMRTFLDDPTEKNFFTVDLLNFKEKTPAVVSDGLRFVTGAVLKGLKRRRGGTADAQGAQGDAYYLRNRAASQIKLAEHLLEEFGLARTDDEVVLQATTGFAPLVIRNRGLEENLNWTYTVALDPEQADYLEIVLRDLCSAIGSPEQEQNFIHLIKSLAQTFSGDDVQDSNDLSAVFSDMGDLPGADKSFLSSTLQVLRLRIESTDADVINQLRKDVCWTSYHFTNMIRAGLYVRPDQLVWTGKEFDVKKGGKATKRTYKYRPIVGAETVFVPDFFFVLPSNVPEQTGNGWWDR